jgi:hypothetical protein
VSSTHACRMHVVCMPTSKLMPPTMRFSSREPGAPHEASFTWDAVLDVLELAIGPQVRLLLAAAS